MRSYCLTTSCIFSWENVAFLSTTITNSFQIELFPNGAIEFRYGTMGTQINRNFAAGVQDTNNAIDVVFPFNVAISGAVYLANSAIAVPSNVAGRFSMLDMLSHTNPQPSVRSIAWAQTSTFPELLSFIHCVTLLDLLLIFCRLCWSNRRARYFQVFLLSHN